MYRALEIAVSRPIVRWKLCAKRQTGTLFPSEPSWRCFRRSAWDRVQVRQVLTNLMLNGIEAIKDMGGELTISSNRTEDGQVRVSVSDLGVGLSR